MKKVVRRYAVCVPFRIIYCINKPLHLFYCFKKVDNALKVKKSFCFLLSTQPLADGAVNHDYRYQMKR